MKKQEFLEKLKIELKLIKKSDFTIRNYIYFNQKLLDFCQKDPEQLTEEDVKKFLADTLIDKASSSIILALAAIRFASLAILKKDITLNIKRPQKNTSLPVILTINEIKKIIESADTIKSRLIIQLLYSSGLRVSEIVNIKPQDMNLEQGTGFVRKGKGKKDRLFTFSTSLSSEISKYLNDHQNNTYLFSLHKPLTPRNIQKIIKHTARKAQIQKKVTPHTFRHSYATHLLEQGTDIRIIQKLLGHENLNTTQIYTQVSTEELRKVKNPLDNIGL